MTNIQTKSLIHFVNLSIKVPLAYLLHVLRALIAQVHFIYMDVWNTHKTRT